MKNWGKIASLIICAALLTSCSSNEKPAESLTPTSAASQTQGQGLSADETRQAMIERSLVSMGNKSRMMNALKKAENGEEITVGYIGGSITEGYLVDSSQCWAKLSYDWLCGQYPDTKINYINAGMSGTPSTLGVIRCERDLYSGLAPDIVFIEYAVNDLPADIYRAAYESLIRKIMKKENNPAVVLLFTITEGGFNCEKQMSEIGEYYDLPMISVENAITPELQSRNLRWNDYSLDDAHPSTWGHRLLSDFVANYWEKVREDMKEFEALPEISPIKSEFLASTSYEEMQLLDSANLTPNALGSFHTPRETFAWFPNGWESMGTEPIEFTVECRALFLIYLCDHEPDFGSADIYVDGELVQSIDSFSPNGWHNPETLLVFSDEQSAIHKVSIKPQSQGSYFGLLGLGAC